MIEVFRYQTEDGDEPLTDWLHSLRDKQVQAKIRVRLKRLEAGNFGDCDPVGEGVQELREHLGAGYRVYFDRDLVVRRIKKVASDRHQDRQGILAILEKETNMSKKIKAAVLHHEREVAELRADRELAVEYLKAAMESLDDPEDRAAGLLALRTIAEAYGGLGAVAAEAGVSRESLYRTLSAKGNPTLKTLLAVLKAVGMKLSVEPDQYTTA